MKTLKMFTDGGSRGNPGPSASAAYFPEENGAGIGVYIGDHRTNNEAEAIALITGLEFAHDNGFDAVDVCSDSKLVVNQVNGRWRVQAPTMIPLVSRAQELMRKFKLHNLQFVPREKNKEADWIVNRILDLAEKGEVSTCQKLWTTPLLQSCASATG